MKTQSELTEKYEKMKNLSYNIAHKFHKRYGGDLEDWIGEARLLLVQALQTYDESYAQLSTWVYIKTKFGLMEYLRKEQKQTDIRKRLKNEPQPARHKNWPELLECLSPDGCHVLYLILNTPSEVIKNLRVHWQIRRKVQQWLSTKLKERGWTYKRINTAVNEIQEALNATTL